jgi:multidrug efflux system outer membrane protein
VTLYKVMGGGWVVEAEKMTTQQLGTKSPDKGAPATPGEPAPQDVQ